MIKPITFSTILDTFNAYQKTVKIPHRKALRHEDWKEKHFLRDEDMI